MISIRLEGIGKDFGAGPVVDDVGFSVEAGKIHALVGENGAGKSTLLKILGGYLPASGGRALLNGAPSHFRDQREAEAEGVVLIHQELNLVDDLTVADNIFLGREQRRGPFLDERANQIQDVYVAGDNPGMGRVSGEYVAQKMTGQGEIVVLRGIPTVIDNQRYDAFMEVMRAFRDHRPRYPIRQLEP